MRLIGQAVPHRHGGVTGQLLNHTLPMPPVLDAVEHAGKHTGGISHRLLLSDLRPCAEHGAMRALIIRRCFKRAAGTRGILFKNQGDAPPVQQAGFRAMPAGRFEARRKIQQKAQFLGAVIGNFQKMSAGQLDHERLLKVTWKGGKEGGSCLLRHICSISGTCCIPPRLRAAVDRAE